MQISDFTHIGARDYQEDRFKITKNFAGKDELTLLVICDGHGGKTAAIWLVDRFGMILKDLIAKDEEKKYTALMSMALSKCVEEWDRKCFGSHVITNDTEKRQFFAGRNTKELKNWNDNELESGSTICACLIDINDRILHILHLGDSRVTWICEGKLIGSTVDHSVPVIMQPIDKFAFVYGDGYVQDDLAMCRSFGDNTEKLFKVISREPDLLKVNLGLSEARIILASDGLFDTVTNHDVLYNEVIDAKAIADQVAKFDDNITVLYVKIPAYEAKKSKPKKQEVVVRPSESNSKSNSKSRKPTIKRTTKDKTTKTTEKEEESEKEEEEEAKDNEVRKSARQKAKKPDTFENMLQNLTIDKKKKLTKKKH